MSHPRCSVIASGVTAIIPNWNHSADLKRLLEALKRQTLPPQEIIVLDNGSTDDSVEMASSAGARVLPMGDNLGFCRAVNTGIRASRTPLTAILNNDVEPEPDWLARLVEVVTRESVWFATGKILDAARRDSIDATFDTISRGACAWRAGNGHPDSPEWDRPRRIQLAPFTAALFRAELFERVGLLDERFESDLEDVDFGLRCASVDCFGAYVPEAKAYHRGSATLGLWHPEKVRRISRNQVLLVAKHFPEQWIRCCGWPVLVGQGLWGLVAARHGTGWAFLRGKLEGLREYRRVRQTGHSSGLFGILKDSEQEIRSLQSHTGSDWYWRLYFALT